MVYKGKNGRYKKLSAERYKYEIFEGYAETVEEVFERTKYAGISELDAENIHKMIWQIADVVCSMIACMDEQAFLLALSIKVCKFFKKLNKRCF